VTINTTFYFYKLVFIDHMKPINLTGKKFGEWLVLKQVERPLTNSPSKPLYWLCKCSCGVERIIPSHNLRCNRSLSCGHDIKLPDFRAIYNHFLSTNEKRKISCHLTFEEFKEFTKISKCHYCHSSITWKTHAHNKRYNLDRKNNNEGYTKENSVVCCTRCNFGKNSRYSYEEWYLMNLCFRENPIIL